MTTELRKTGIAAVGDMPWGTHFCHFYQTQQDLLDIFVPYLKAGLENNEFCMWVTAEPLSEETRNALRRAIPGADRHLAAGEIEILSYTQWYLKDGTFDSRRVTNGWNTKLGQALANGYAGLRVAADEAWLGKKYWKAFSEYEKELDEPIANQRMIVLCAYPLAASGADAIFDVTRTHQFAIAERNGNWESLETPELKQAKAQLKRLNEELEQRVVERTRELETINEALRQEIAERKQAEEALRASEEQTRLIVDSAYDAFIAIAANGLITAWNHQAEVTFGWSRAEAIGRLLSETIIPAQHQAAHKQGLARFLVTGKGPMLNRRIEVTALHCDGHEFPVELTITPIRWGDNFLFSAFVHDITERKQVEEELRQHREHLEELVTKRTAELAVAKDKAEEADRLKSAFLATMSHELRSPLNSIIGFAGILLQGLVGPLNDEQQLQLNIVKSSARHLLNLINEVLDLSKIEAGQMELHPESFDMPALIDQTIQALAPLAEKKGLQLMTELTPEVERVFSDPRRVKQILINLVNNAIKFTEQGQVRLECRVCDGWLLTSVVDTGIGIKPEDMGKLFTTFRQLDSTLARQHEGAGLGLAICQKLADLLGGEVRVESAWGVGSNFTFALPLNRPGE